MGLELVVHSTLRSGYFHYGNNHFFVKFPLYNMSLRTLMTVGTQAINNIQADTSTQSRISFREEYNVPLSPTRL